PLRAPHRTRVTSGLALEHGAGEHRRLRRPWRRGAAAPSRRGRAVLLRRGERAGQRRRASARHDPAHAPNLRDAHGRPVEAERRHDHIPAAARGAARHVRGPAARQRRRVRPDLLGGGHLMPLWLRWVRLALRLCVEERRAAWRAGGTVGIHAAVDALVADAAPTPGDDVLAAARAEVDADPTWARLADGFRLTREERELLALVAAVHVDPPLRRRLGYLHDDPRPAPPTRAGAGGLGGWASGGRPAPSGGLAAWALAAPAGPEPWQPTARWTADPDVVSYLCGNGDWAGFWPGLDRAPADTPCF